VSNPFPAGVQYGTIDLATVRVFAMREVRAQQVQGARYPRTIAVPEAGHGTGVVIDPRGVVLTAAHVIDGARHVAVRLPNDAGVLSATVIHQDENLDFALLLTRPPSGRFTHYLELPSAQPPLAVRQTVDAIGYPLDATREQPQSTRGIISGALDDGRLQLGMSVNPGNSGGPLVDEEEHLVGIVVARGRVEEGVQGIAIAIPTLPMRGAYERALETGAFHRGNTELGTDPENRRNTAVVLDALIRFGGADVLLEAADVVHTGAAPERLRRFTELVQQTRDPDLLAMLCGYFWDALMVMLEAAGVANPGQLQPPTRELALTVDRWARYAARTAVEADATVTQRHPFMQFMQRLRGIRGPDALNASASASSLGFASGRAPTRPNAQREGAPSGWAPTVWVGVARHYQNISNGRAADFGVSFPIWLFGRRSSRLRIAPVLGLSIQSVHYEDRHTPWAAAYYDYESDDDNQVVVVSPFEAGLQLRVGTLRTGFVVNAAVTYGRVIGVRHPLWGGRLLAGFTSHRLFVGFNGKIVSYTPDSDYFDGRYGHLGFAAGVTY